MAKDDGLTVFRTVYVERIKGDSGDNIFRVTRCVNMETPLPGDTLDELQYVSLVKNKYIRVIADPDGKVSHKS